MIEMKRNFCKISVRIRPRKGPFRKARRRWEADFEMDRTQIGYQRVKWAKMIHGV
jgi:hypothetical protein